MLLIAGELVPWQPIQYTTQLCEICLVYQCSCGSQREVEGLQSNSTNEEISLQKDENIYCTVHPCNSGLCQEFIKFLTKSTWVKARSLKNICICYFFKPIRLNILHTEGVLTTFLHPCNDCLIHATLCKYKHGFPLMHTLASH